MKNKVSVNNTGIESSGLTKDYMEAMGEYIWNGFDADAKKVSIEFETNEIGTLNEIKIADDGTGIDFALLGKTFGNFNDSIKKNSYQKSSSSIRGNKGKGRFSFTAFSGQARWETVYKEPKENKFLEYDIVIKRNAKEFFEDSNQKIASKTKTGTIVTLSQLFEVTANSFQCDEFYNCLAREFGWFLFLNNEHGYTIKINERDLSYQNLIAESEVSILPIKDSDGKANNFKITFIRWNEKIGDKFYFYYLDFECFVIHPFY